MKTLDKMLKTSETLTVEDVQADLTEALQCIDQTDLKCDVEDIQAAVSVAHRLERLDIVFESVGSVEIDLALHNIVGLYNILIQQSYINSDEYNAAALFVIKDKVKIAIDTCASMIKSSIAR